MKPIKKVFFSILSCTMVLSTQIQPLLAMENTIVQQTATTETFIDDQKFPDTRFRQALLDEYHLETLEDIEKVTSLDLRYCNIQSLEGIKYFTNLETLDVSLNRLTSLDVSQNQKLRWLDAGNNQSMTQISLPDSLEYLDCFDNGIREIDLSHLDQLWYLNMTANDLSTIDLSYNEQITHLFLDDNHLKTLDLSHQIHLDPYFFSLYENLLTSIKTPNISKTVAASQFYKQKDSTGYERKWKYNDVVFYSDDQVEFDGTTITSEVTPKQYQINYHSNNGTNAKETVSYTFGEEIKISENHFKQDGYTFQGWALNQNAATVTYKENALTTLSEYPEKGVLDLYAIWAGNSYTVRFHGNNGTQDTITQNLTFGQSTALLANTFKNDGKHFVGWSQSIDGKINYRDKEIVSNLTNQDHATIDLYAQWEDNVYKVTFDANGGKLSETGNQMVKHNENLQKPVNPTRQGYTFQGWKNKKTNTLYDFQTPVTGEMTLVAVWQKNTYSVVFDANGGHGEMNSLSLSYDSSVALPTNKFIKTDYEFAGWSLSKDKSVVYNDQEVVKNLTDQDQETVVLYAKWTPVNYQISYQLNGGKAVSNPASYNVESATITLKNPVRNGYAFQGWYSDSSYRNKVTQIVQGSTGNKTLYAKWTPVKYNLRYVLNRGSVKGNPTTYTITTKTFSLKNPTRKGYLFGGWYSDNRYRTKVTKITTGSTGDKTLYAKWIKVAKPAKVKLRTVKNNAKKSMSVSFVKNKNVSGYQIAYSTSSKFTKKTTKYTTSSSIKNLRKGKTYYVKVRSYKKDSTGAKIYGAYSQVKKVKIKK